MKRFWITLVAAGMLAIAAIAPAAAQETIDIELGEIDESGVTGTATLTAENGSTVVTIQLEGAPEDGDHPVHIHDGSCEDLGPVAYPLENVVDGESETTVEVELSELLTGEHAINVHLSPDDMATWVACGDIPEAGGMGGDGDAAEDDEEATDDEDGAADNGDEAAEDDDDAAEDDDEAMEDEEADEVEDVTPNAGSTGGIGPDTAALFMVLLAGGVVGTGVILRRRQYQPEV